MNLAQEQEPLGTITLPMISTTLFHILELAKILGEIAQAVCSVAWLLGELEEETVAEATCNTMNDYIDMLNVETKGLLDKMRTTLAVRLFES